MLPTDAVLRRLHLDVTRKLDGLLHGDYLGLVPGHGSEPGEARRYEIGDDVRRIDWNVTARTQAIHVRDTIADRELELTLVVDRSASLEFGTARCTKADLALAGTAALAFLAVRGANRIGGVVVHPGGIRTVPPTHGRAGAFAMLRAVQTTTAEDGTGSTGLAAGLHHAAQTARRRGLVGVISDFLEAEGWERRLRALAARHDVVCVEVVDPRELELPDVGVLTMIDPETGRTIEVPTSRKVVRDRFADAAASQRAAIAAAIRAAGAGHVQLRTDRDWIIDLARYVNDRKRLRGALARRLAT